MGGVIAGTGGATAGEARAGGTGVRLGAVIEVSEGEATIDFLSPIAESGVGVVIVGATVDTAGVVVGGAVDMRVVPAAC